MPDIFAGLPDPTLTISIHANPALDYPFYTGYESENTNIVSFKNPQGHYNKNIVFQPGTTLAKYLKHLDDALALIRQFEPDVLIVPFGADTFKNDPDASSACRCQLEIVDYQVIGKAISDAFPGKIIVLQEGGYDMANVGFIVDLFLSGFL